MPLHEYTIRQLVEQVGNGQIRLPSFQRGFVWEPYSIAFLMDSIYKGFPIGTLLFWRSRQQLANERRIGPFELIERQPDYPVDYVLDGQQRITSLFGVFQSSLVPIEDGEESFNIFFDMESEPNTQETQFFAFSDGEDAYRTRYFPIKTIFDVLEYRRATENLTAPQIQKVDFMQTRFREATIPIQIIDTNDKSRVAIVFERINRKGVPLDTYQLLTAWTWSEEFDLQDNFKQLSEELEPFGFEEVGEDVDLILRCFSAVITGRSTTSELMEVSGAVVRDHFESISNGIKGAVDFLRRELKIEKVKNLPFTTIIVPLSAFFAVPGCREVLVTAEQRAKLLRWFWRSCFSKRYSAGVIRNLDRDIGEMKKLRDGAPSVLDTISCDINEAFFAENKFSVNSVNTKTFVLLLAQRNPRSFLSGSPIDLANVLQNYNRNEFHHIYPEAFLNGLGITDSKIIYCLANFAFLKRAENRLIGAQSPSSYATRIPEPKQVVFNSALIPTTFSDDNYKSFLEERSKLLKQYALSLLNQEPNI